MAMIEHKVHRYTCDNPACDKVVLHDPDDSPRPDGFFGNAEVVQGGRSVQGGPFFAHSRKCVTGAVAAMIDPPKSPYTAEEGDADDSNTPNEPLDPEDP